MEREACYQIEFRKLENRKKPDYVHHKYHFSNNVILYCISLANWATGRLIKQETVSIS